MEKMSNGAENFMFSVAIGISTSVAVAVGVAAEHYYVTDTASLTTIMPWWMFAIATGVAIIASIVAMLLWLAFFEWFNTKALDAIQAFSHAMDARYERRKERIQLLQGRLDPAGALQRRLDDADDDEAE